MGDLYKILGVDSTATSDEIKKAHRQLAKEHHPDKNDGQTSEHFLNVQRAYEALINPATRAMYDQYGFTKIDEQFAKLSGIVAQLVQHCINTGVAANQIINEAERQLNTVITNLQNQQDKVKVEIDKLRAQKDALKIKDDSKLDIVGETILGLMRGKEGELSQLKEGIQVNKQLLEMLDNYEKGTQGTSTALNFHKLQGSTFRPQWV